MEARGLTGRARPLYSAGFATSPSGRCPISPCGGIGRRARLKIEFRKECWFDSGQGHHPPSLTTLRVADVRQRRARSTQHHFKASETGRTVAQICGFQIFRDRVGARLLPGKWERQQARPHYRRSAYRKNPERSREDRGGPGRTRRPSSCAGSGTVRAQNGSRPQAPSLPPSKVASGMGTIASTATWRKRFTQMKPGLTVPVVFPASGPPRRTSHRALCFCCYSAC